MNAAFPTFLLKSPLGQVLRPEFQAGLVIGLLGLGLVLLAGALLRLSSGQGRPLPVAGLVVVGAGVAALAQTDLLADNLALGLGALVLGGLVADISRAGWPATVLLAVPGAWLTAFATDLPEGTWIRVAVLAGVVGGGTLLSDFDARWGRRGLAPVLLAVSILGIYATVPSTDQALVLVGLALPLALTSWPWPVASLGVAGSLASSGLVAWTIAVGGAGRTSSIVGGLACLGLLVLEPVTRGIRRDRPSALELLISPRPRSVVVIALAHLVVVYVASRVAGLRATVAEATVILAVEVTVVLAVLALGSAAARKRRPEWDEGDRAISHSGPEASKDRVIEKAETAETARSAG